MERRVATTTEVTLELNEQDVRTALQKLGMIPEGWQYFSVEVSSPAHACLTIKLESNHHTC